MSKAVQGAAMLGAAVATGAAIFFTGGAALAALPFLEPLMQSLVVGGIAMEAGAIADALTQNRGIGITTRQPAAFRQVIYGTQRVGGIIVYQSTTGNELDQYNFIIVIAGHVVNAIQNLYLDGRQVFWSGSGDGNVTRNGINFGGNASNSAQIGPGGQHYNFGGLVYCEARFGDQPPGDYIQAVQGNDPNWVPSSAGTPSLMGCTYVYLKIEYDPSMFPNLPEIKFDVQGKNNIYDPRTDTTGYSANWALVVADVLTDPVFGLGDNSVNQAQLIAAANVCDEQIDLAAGGTESQYCCHWHYDSSVGPGDALQTMMPAAAGRLSRIGGEWYIWPAYWQGPSFTFDESALTAPMQWNPYRSFRELINVVNGTYIAPASPWNVAGNLYDGNGWYDGTIADQFPFAFQPTNYPSYAEDVLHGYSTDQWRDDDSGVLGAWDSGTTYSLGDAVTLEGVIYQSQADSNTGNTPGPATLSSGWEVYAGNPSTGDYTVSNWAAGTYASGDIVSYDGCLYQCTADGTTDAPTAAPWWLPWTGIALPKEIVQNCVLSISQAQRCAKIYLTRNRQQGSGVFQMALTCWQMQPLDVMQFTFANNDWSDKQLEIVSTGFKVDRQDDGAPVITFQCGVQETDESVYEWDPSTEELSPYDVAANPQTLPYAITPPSGLTLEADSTTALIGADGVVTPRILVSWTPPGDARVTAIQIQYQLEGASTWTNGDLVNAGATSDYITGVIAGQSYNVQIASVTAAGAMSVWVSASVTVAAPNSLQSSYAMTPQFALTQPSPTEIALAATSVSFGGLAAVSYAARTFTIPAPSGATWYYVTIADPTQVGEGGSPTLTATCQTSDALVGVQGNTYLGAIEVTPTDADAVNLSGGWPASPTFVVVS